MTTGVHVTEVEGITVLLAPTAGPMRAGLVFRVGRADETLATNGVTHLVEHLTLHRHGTPDYHYNGMTSATTTQFVTQGTPEKVAGFLADVCAGLRALPLQRLATEKKILQTEAASRPTSVNGLMPLWRHGAQNFGLLSYPEWGVHTLTEEQVEHWARTRFNRANAVLWIAGDRVPEGLRLELPEGERWALPGESCALPVMPATFGAGSSHLVLDAQVPRTRAAALYTRLLERALFRELRQSRGISYTAAATYTTDGRPKATMTAFADVQPGEVHNAIDAFLGVLSGLERGEIDPAEFETVRSLALAAFDDPETEANLLPRRATDLLTGYDADSTEKMVETFRASAPDDVREVAIAVRESALLMVPESVRFVTGFEAAPTFSRFGVRGPAYWSRVAHGTTLVHGGDGVSVTTAPGSVTVLFDECTALLRWPDGARQMIGRDGIGVSIEPTLYRVPQAVLTAIDRAVPAESLVDMPTRSQQEIPQPARAAGARSRLRRMMLPLRVRHGRLATMPPLAGGVALALSVLAVVSAIMGEAKAASISAAIVGTMLVMAYRNTRS